MKDIIVPQFSEYMDMEGRIISAPADMIIRITKKELTDLLISKIGYNTCGETAYTELFLDDGTLIKVKINDILFNPEKLEVTNNTPSSLQDVYIDKGTEVTMDLGDGTGYEGTLTGIMCTEIDLNYSELVKLKEGHHLGPLGDCRIKQNDGSTLVTDISDLNLVN